MREPDQDRGHEDLEPSGTLDLSRSSPGDWTYHVEGDELERPAMALPALLFLTTVFTTLWAGAYQTRTDPYIGAWAFLSRDPSVLLKGIPFSATLLGILVTHEFGHYIFSRIHRVPASLPLFIPGPPHFIGTFGAIIRMRGPILNKRALFDIGVAGPIAGFVVAVVALVVGLQFSRVVPDIEVHEIMLGPSALLAFFIWLFVDPVPQGYIVDLHPVAAAAWFGLFITSLNLIPIGQLDGGHVAYALWDDRQRSMAMAMIPILLVLGLLGWQGWFLWAALGGIIGLAHPPVADPQARLGKTRVWIGWAALAIFLLTFSPIPFAFR
jgi:membrane-associated protease RseP (regulator of RpoE activity)